MSKGFRHVVTVFAGAALAAGVLMLVIKLTSKVGPGQTVATESPCAELPSTRASSMPASAGAATVVAPTAEEDVNSVLGDIREDTFAVATGQKKAVAGVSRQQELSAAITDLLEKPDGAVLLVRWIRKASASDLELIRAVLQKRYAEDPDADARGTMLIGLSRLGDIATLELAMQKDSNPGTRRFAAHLLSRVATEQQIPALLEVIRGDQGNKIEGRVLAGEAIRTIGAIGGKAASSTLMSIWQDKKLSAGRDEDIIYALGTTGDPAVFDALEKVAKGDNTTLRGVALGAAGELARKNARNDELRQRAMVLVGQYLSDETAMVREQAVNAIRKIGTSDDIPALKTLMDDPTTSTVSYMENGQVKTKRIYPVREAASQAIRIIESRQKANKEN